MSLPIREEPPELSVVIPMLDESSTIQTALAAVTRADGQVELIVVDGGSRDDGLELAAALGARVLSAPKGRGTQLAVGARAARGKTLWFLHADALPAPGSLDALRVALGDPTVLSGTFLLRFDGATSAARVLTRLHLLARMIGLGYGDASIFVRREVYFDLGGFKDYPLFEDLDLIRRLRRHGGWTILPNEVIASARRLERHPWLTCMLWIGLQLLYWAGVPPRLLARLYPPIRPRISPVAGAAPTAKRDETGHAGRERSPGCGGGRHRI